MVAMTNHGTLLVLNQVRMSLGLVRTQPSPAQSSNPLRFVLTPGQDHNLAGADALLLHMTADVVIADKAYDADERVIRLLASTGKSAVIPPRRNRSAPREFDQELYKARHLIENFLCRLK
jgi:transposase